MQDDEVTQILAAADRGDPHALGRLLPLVYEELRQLAAQKLAREPAGHTLQATALVNEAYLRLVGSGGDQTQKWSGRRHFFGAAAEAMRRILVESARRKRSLKRGGGLGRADVAPDEIAAPPAPEGAEDLVALDEALGRFAAEDPTAAELVKLRYFVGLSMRETAEVLDISPRTADRLWVFAKAWLRQALTSA